MKSHASMEQAQCPVCLKTHDTGRILLDRRLRQSMEWHTVTHFAMCPEHQKMRDEGYIALVEVVRPPHAGENALCVPRTGNYAHVKAEAWPKIFNVPIPEKGLALMPTGVLEKLQAMTTPSEPSASPS